MITRNSWSIKLLRKLQKSVIPSLIIPFEKLLQFALDKTLKDIPVICVLAPPRSGSTLTYQLLASGIKSYYLDNFTNFFYKTPIFGLLIEKLVNPHHVTSYKSSYGFVSGINGEAEGLQFWSYWMNQKLDESEEPNDTMLHLLEKKLRIVYATGIDRPFITCYLGHVFSINHLRSIFKKILFIHVKRDNLSNAVSIYKIRKKTPETWFSTHPKGIPMDLSLPEQIIMQIKRIHEIIDRDTDPKDTIQITYEEICENPKKVLEIIASYFKKTHNIEIKLRLAHVPTSFNISIKNHDDLDSKYFK